MKDFDNQIQNIRNDVGGFETIKDTARSRTPLLSSRSAMKFNDLSAQQVPTKRFNELSNVLVPSRKTNEISSYQIPTHFTSKSKKTNEPTKDRSKT